MRSVRSSDTVHGPSKSSGVEEGVTGTLQGVGESVVFTGRLSPRGVGGGKGPVRGGGGGGGSVPRVPWSCEHDVLNRSVKPLFALSIFNLSSSNPVPFD